MKKIWMTSMESTRNIAKQITDALGKYGLAVEGHVWEDDNDKMAWVKATEAILDSETSLWAILGSGDELVQPSIFYGLSMLATKLNARREMGFPIVILQEGGQIILTDSLPTPLNRADVILADDAALGAKLVAKIHGFQKKVVSDYHFDIHGNEQIGQWFEVGPKQASWSGAMFGVTSAEIVFQAVGPRGKLPEKAILEYPMQGLKLNMGEKEYVTWAVQNEINDRTSYFVKVDGHPESILFGPYSNEAETDVFVLRFK